MFGRRSGLKNGTTPAPSLTPSHRSQHHLFVLLLCREIAKLAGVASVVGTLVVAESIGLFYWGWTFWDLQSVQVSLQLLSGFSVRLNEGFLAGAGHCCNS